MKQRPTGPPVNEDDQSVQSADHRLSDIETLLLRIYSQESQEDLELVQQLIHEVTSIIQQATGKP
ncbi:hypothetical protein [Stieleria varia]|uniref:Uncharacterized protein n=1 Tax=Stieleria varia TaxID=2528005 RepID=A0A5C6AFW1_9BACT|nr:hypothetical protein [Stieleria varia]TWT98330.1 hypothetical protein Pla52n_48420 [Stieleria varia]